MVLIGSAKLSRRAARPEGRRSQRRPTRIAPRHPLCSWMRPPPEWRLARTGDSARRPVSPHLTMRSVHAFTLAIHRSRPRLPSVELTPKSVCLYGRAAKPRPSDSTSHVNTQCRCRHRVNPDCGAVGDRCWWTITSPTASRRSCLRLTRGNSHRQCVTRQAWVHRCGPTHDESRVAFATKKRTVACCCGLTVPPSCP